MTGPRAEDSVAGTPAATALAVVHMARQGQFAAIAERFAPPLRPMAPPEVLRAAWRYAGDQRGPW